MKRFLIFTSILGILFVAFALVFFFRESTTQTPLEQIVAEKSENSNMSSSLYRYDFSEETYIAETSKSWQNSDFTVYIFDTSHNASIDECEYFVYDAVQKTTKVLSKRECNAPLTITVGKGRMCSSQGRGACLLYVYAKDQEGAAGEVGIGTYDIDYTSPQTSRIFLKDNQSYPFFVELNREALYITVVSDNEQVFGCWLYADGNLVGQMKISADSCGIENPCQARFSYALPADEEHHILTAQCADHYNSKDKSYVNIGRGEAVEVIIKINHAPEISSCRVLPTQGTPDTEFIFRTTVSDPDEDQLLYNWDFGDGTLSQKIEPRHVYNQQGVFRPRVTIRDGQGEEVQCATAWVSITK